MSSQDLLSLQQKTTSPAPQPQPLQPQQQQPTGPKDATSPAPQPQPQAQQEPSSQGNPKAGPGKRQHSKMLPVKPLPPPPPKGKKKAEEVEVAEAEDKEGEANPAPAPAPVTAPVTPGGVFEVPVEFDSPTSVPPGDLVDNIQQRLAAPAFCDIAVAVKVRGQAGGCATVLALVEHEGECAVFVLTLIGSALVLTETIPLVPGVVERTSRNTIQDEAQQQQQQQQQQQHGTGAATAAPSATPVPPPPPPPTTTPAFIEFRRHGKPSVTFEAADPTSPTSSLTISLFEQIIPAKAASSAPTALTLLSGSPHGWLKNYPKSKKKKIMHNHTVTELLLF